jgi:hypothetical protein
LLKFENDIRHFFSVFREFLRFIDEKCAGRFESVALICIYLDSLSGYKYGARRNRKRFIDFVLKYSGLKDTYSKVCLPLLRDQLEKQSRTRKDLIDFFTSELCIVEPKNASSLIYENSDISYIDLKTRLESHFSREDVAKTMGLAKRLRYIDYFYEHYRCKVVHEARFNEKDAQHFGHPENPYYVPVGLEDHTKEIWFGIPYRFMFKTLENCINNFEKECIDNDINPFRALD